jgi:hypothetical protein
VGRDRRWAGGRDSGFWHDAVGRVKRKETRWAEIGVGMGQI